MNNQEKTYLQLVEENRKFREAFAEISTRFQLVERIGNIGYWDWYLDSGELAWSDEVYRIFGQDKATYKPHYDAFNAQVHPDDYELLNSERLKALSEKRDTRLEHRIVRPDGEIRYIVNSAKFILDDNEEIIRVSGIVQDITERKRSEEALQESEKLSQEYINSLPGLFYVFDEKRFIRWNKLFNEITGYSDEELANMYGTDFFEGDDRNNIGKRMLEVFQEGFSEAEAYLVTKQGRKIPYYCTGKLIEVKGKRFLIGLGIDISERKQAEDEKLSMERQIQHAQKLESLGVLAGGIAHDFNNLLMGVLGNADMALMSLTPESPVRSYIEKIQNASARLADLTQQMLAYSGKSQIEVETLDLSRLVEEMAPLLKISTSKKVVLKCETQESLPPIKADANQIRQVVMDLITNAAESYGEEGGIVSVYSRLLHLDRSALSGYLLAEELPGGDYVLLEISDIGCGMEKETIEKIFDPFFSTKFTGRGLGLASVLGIIRSHCGAIKVTSQPRLGTTVKILIPSEKVECFESQEINPAASQSFHGQGMVLLVDDDEIVLDIGKMMLEKIGFTVICAVDGFDAVEQVRYYANELVCVLLDLTMPKMDGIEAFGEIRNISGDLPVILCSGYNSKDFDKKFADKGITHFLQKPFRYQSLVDKLQEILGNTDRTNQN